MNGDKIRPVTHLNCGREVTWRLGNEERPGGPFCGCCQREVPRDELSSQSTICVVGTTSADATPA